MLDFKEAHRHNVAVYNALSAAALPIDGFCLEQDRIDFKEEATAAQRRQAASILASYKANPIAFVAARETETLRKRAAAVVLSGNDPIAVAMRALALELGDSIRADKQSLGQPRRSNEDVVKSILDRIMAGQGEISRK